MKLVYFSSAFLLGVFAGSRLEPPSLPLLIVAAALAPALLGLMLSRKRSAALYLATAMFLIFGLARGASDVPGDSALTPYLNLPQTQVRGTIDSYPVPRDALSQFLFDVDAVNTNGTWTEVSESILVRARPTPELVGLRDPPYFRYGDSLRLTGTLQVPPVLGDFDWRDHLAQEGVHSIMFRPGVVYLQDDQGFPLLDLLFDLRADLARSTGKALPEPQASLSHAMALGLRGTLPTELKEDLAGTGTTHLVAISGLHIGIVVGMVSLLPRFLFGRQRRLMVFVVLLVLVWGYALLTGLAPPVLRAAIMGSIFLWAMYLGRQRSALPALAAAAAAMVALDPGALDEVSFQLSFLAMAGLILLAPWFRAGGRFLLSRALPSEGIATGLGTLAIDAIAISLAAILATPACHSLQLSPDSTCGSTGYPGDSARLALYPWHVSAGGVRRAVLIGTGHPGPGLDRMAVAHLYGRRRRVFRLGAPLVHRCRRRCYSHGLGILRDRCVGTLVAEQKTG